MFKLLLNGAWRGNLGREMQESLSWLCDPLAHPALDRMSMTELGDLPLGGVRYDCDGRR